MRAGLSLWLVIVAAVVFLAGYGFYAEVMRENAYLSCTAEVQEGQKVIDTGLYGVVRNPMYFATLLLMPVGYPPIIIWRIFDQEKTLAVGLPGYRKYMGRVKYRLLPFIR